MELCSSTEGNAFITVFTPTYNRAGLLHRIYDSLLRQTDRGFRWLIIDDGSADDTKAVVDRFMQEGKIEIIYVYKPNGGLHTGYNAAIERLDTELSVCIDSDDWLAENAIEKIRLAWEKYGAEDVAGLIGLDYTADGKLIGGHLPDGAVINPVDLMASRTNRGDKKYVIRTDCYKRVAPMPEYPGEKNFNPHYLVLKLCADYRFIGLDTPLCIVDYQPDGMTANQFRQYLDSPRSFAQLRKVILALPGVSPGYRVRTAIHYCSSSQLAHDKDYLRSSPRPLLTALCTPAGWMLTGYIKRKADQTE